MDYKTAAAKLEAARGLLTQPTLSVGTFEQISTLVRGVNPDIDSLLDQCSNHLAIVKKFRQEEFTELTVQTLPEDTDEQKKRKKALLFLIRSLKKLRDEVTRAEHELSQTDRTIRGNGKKLGKLFASAKGPAGIITVAAVAIAFVLISRGISTGRPSAPAPNSEPYIMVNTHKVALTEFHIGTGNDCDSPHYHAKQGTVTSFDGTVIADPGGCGFGKVGSVPILR